MDTAQLRSRATSALLDFAWDEWAQLGLSAAQGRSSKVAQDPEALIVFTVGLARHDPRLFDELLDWLTLNGDLVNGRRLVRLAQSAGTGRLVGAVASWATEHGAPLQLVQKKLPPQEPQLLFPALRPPTTPDPVFERYALVKGPTAPSKKSARPDLELPAAFAFRLRALFGVGTRAEIVRFLLTSGVPGATTLAIADAAVSAKRNVNVALGGLAASGQVQRITVGNAAWYGVDRARWAGFLGLAVDELPSYRDWPTLLGAMAVILAWLDDPATSGLDDYLRASEARRIMQPLAAKLAHAGVEVVTRGHGEEYWESFTMTVEHTVAAIRA